MNGMNKAIFLVVSIIALLFSGLCFALTLDHFISSNGDVDFFLFLPLNGELGIDITEKSPGFVADILGYYQQVLDKLVELISMDGMRYEIELALVVIGFALAALGFATKPSMDVQGRTNPAEYLWTHRPKAFSRCLAMPFGLIVACWQKFKPLVIVPVILLPLYLPWAIMMVIFLILPFLIVKAIIGSKIKTASKKEEKAYQQNTEFGVCPHCKRNFDRPLVKCKCGLMLDYPVPNEYGYKYHTCNKGHTIPCVSGKRGSLTTVCPHCSMEIETREAHPITISFVGAVGTGKTSLMLAAVDAISQRARAVDVSVDSPSSGLSKDAITAREYAPHTPSGELESQMLFLRSMKLQEREIIFNDISGTEFEANMNKVIFEEYYNYTDGIVFTFDPMAFSRNVRAETPQEVFDSFHYMFTAVRRSSPSAKSDIPFAVVATKADIVKPALKDEDVRDFLVQNGQESFVMIAESLFTDVRYFSVSSHGSGSDSAMRPVWWIAGHTDKKLTEYIQSP